MHTVNTIRMLGLGHVDQISREQTIDLPEPGVQRGIRGKQYAKAQEFTESKLFSKSLD